ncbi:MAG: hypothetical protein Ct9H300mP1_16300 [Planctomycetaceae bacterium]|nr:MAG: hypothetical protein Ct9H300mP1_16300 [Planctomycetaceae bacterium]
MGNWSMRSVSARMRDAVVQRSLYNFIEGNSSAGPRHSRCPDRSREMKMMLKGIDVKAAAIL